MSLSSFPDWYLVSNSNNTEQSWNRYICYISNTQVEMPQLLSDQELDFRVPNEAASYFGDCAGIPIFIPIEPEYDSNGQPIIEEVIGYDEQGEIWL